MPKRRGASSRNLDVGPPVLLRQSLSETPERISSRGSMHREPASINRQAAPASRSLRQQNAIRSVTSAQSFQKDEHALREMTRRHISYEVNMLRELAAALQGKGVGPR